MLPVAVQSAQLQAVLVKRLLHFGPGADPSSKRGLMQEACSKSLSRIEAAAAASREPAPRGALWACIRTAQLLLPLAAFAACTSLQHALCSFHCAFWHSTLRCRRIPH